MSKLRKSIEFRYVKACERSQEGYKVFNLNTWSKDESNGESRGEVVFRSRNAGKKRGLEGKIVAGHVWSESRVDEADALAGVEGERREES